jgi:hypothetical protein
MAVWGADTVMPVTMCGGPLLALVNLVFVRRDRAAGRATEASTGLFLSMLAFLIGCVPLAFAD